MPDAAPPVLVTAVAMVVLAPRETGLGEAVVAVTVKLGGPAGGPLNVAVTERLAVIVTAHAPVPLHPPPLQPAKDEPGVAAAVSVTPAPLA
jgi:hypothetical protein